MTCLMKPNAITPELPKALQPARAFCPILRIYYTIIGSAWPSAEQAARSVKSGS